MRVLHLGGPRLTAETDPLVLGYRLLDQLGEVPDLVVVSGDITNSGRVGEFSRASALFALLRDALRLPAEHLVVVPGKRDVTLAMAAAHFHHCAAEQIPPKPPYWPKWKHYHRFFESLHEQSERIVFSEDRPWSLVVLQGIRVVVAALNSTMAISHRSEDQFGFVGKQQARWFADQLTLLARPGWIRLAAINHVPAPYSAGNVDDILRDSAVLERALAGNVDLLMHGPGGKAVSSVATCGVDGPGHATMIRISTGIDREPGIVDQHPILF